MGADEQHSEVQIPIEDGLRNEFEEEADVFTIKPDDTPRKKKIKRAGYQLKLSNISKNQLIKRLKATDRRNKLKIKKIQDVLRALEKKIF